MGEFGFIARVARRAGASGPGVVLGIGDDAAVLRTRPGEDVVVSTDALVEGVHFRFETQSARRIGRRAVVAALSDLAAMGARPLGCTLALAAPGDLPLSTADALAAGVAFEAERHGCPLVGGNVARAGETSLTLAVVGAAERGRVLTRTGARAGDRILVTGVLGRSALELARAERGGGRVRFLPVPRLRAGRALARVAGVGACIDVSDGLSADLEHLLAPAGLAVELERERLPRPRGFAAACARLGLDPAELLLTGGEDYELLFTLRPAAPSAARLARQLGAPVTEIGRAVPAARGGRRHGAGGWSHY